MFQRKAFEKLKYWKNNKAPKYSVLLEGARRVGKTTIAEEFAKQEYRSYIKIDFANIRKDVSDAFEDIADLNLFFLRLQTATGITMSRHYVEFTRKRSQDLQSSDSMVYSATVPFPIKKSRHFCRDFHSATWIRTRRFMAPRKPSRHRQRLPDILHFLFPQSRPS